MAWFNRISPDGLHVVGQVAPENTIVLDGVSHGPGLTPVWWSRTCAIWSVPDTTIVRWFDVVTKETGEIEFGHKTNSLQGWGNGVVIAAHRGNPVGWTALFLDKRIVYSPGDNPYLKEDGTFTWDINPSLWQGRIVGGFYLWMQDFASPYGDTRLVVSRLNKYTQGWVVAVGDTFDPDMRETDGGLRVVYTARGGATKDVVVDTSAPMVALTGDPPPPPPPPPPTMEPRITIVGYTPDSGVPPLRVKAVWAPEKDSGPISRLEWLSRREGSGEWLIAATNDPEDPDHTYTFAQGRWEIALRATGPGGEGQTGRKRLIIVEEPAAEVVVQKGDLIDVGNGHGAQVVTSIRLDGALKVLTLEDAEIPPPPPPPPAGKRSGNFLAFPGYEMDFLYGAWDEEKRAAWRAAYKNAGHNWFPLSPWASYGGKSYDFSRDPEGFNALLRELQADGIEPIVMLYTDAFKVSHPRSLDEAKTWAKEFVPKLTTIRYATSGWEFNQINGSEWTGDGTKHLEWAKVLRTLLPSNVKLFAHFSPERITGWPNYPDHSGPQDEPGWWKGNNPFDGLLYQRAPDEPISKLLDHTVGGNGDVGDASRIAGSYWGLSGKEFYLFEFAREAGRHAEVVAKVKDNPLISGWC